MKTKDEILDRIAHINTVIKKVEIELEINDNDLEVWERNDLQYEKFVLYEKRELLEWVLSDEKS